MGTLEARAHGPFVGYLFWEMFSNQPSPDPEHARYLLNQAHLFILSSGRGFGAQRHRIDRSGI